MTTNDPRVAQALWIERAKSGAYRSIRVIQHCTGYYCIYGWTKAHKLEGFCTARGELKKYRSLDTVGQFLADDLHVMFSVEPDGYYDI